MELKLSESERNENLTSDEVCRIADALVAEGKYQRAIDCLSFHLAIHPFDEKLRHIRGRKYIGFLKFAESVADLETVIRINTEDWEARYYLGVSYYLEGDYASSRHFHLEALERIQRDNLPIVPACVDWIWMSSMKLGDYEHAQKILECVDEHTETEDTDYRDRVLLYKKVYSPVDFVNQHKRTDLGKARSDIYERMLKFGLSNYYRYIEKDDEKAKQLYREILASPDHHNLFAYIQSGQEMERLME